MQWSSSRHGGNYQMPFYFDDPKLSILDSLDCQLVGVSGNPQLTNHTGTTDNTPKKQNITHNGK
jgi:hypothetical protein